MHVHTNTHTHTLHAHTHTHTHTYTHMHTWDTPPPIHPCHIDLELQMFGDLKRSTPGDLSNPEVADSSVSESIVPVCRKSPWRVKYFSQSKSLKPFICYCLSSKTHAHIAC